MTHMLYIIFQYWTIAIVLGFLLILFRDDAKTILKDMRLVLVKPRSMWLIIAHFSMLCVIIPLSIPYSVANIINRWL